MRGAETYRETEGGIEVLINDQASGVIPAGHPREQEVRRLAAAGKLVVQPAPTKPQDPEPTDPEPTLKQVVAALIRRGVIEKGDIDAEQR